jgi:hypothetical protein
MELRYDCITVQPELCALKVGFNWKIIEGTQAKYIEVVSVEVAVRGQLFIDIIEGLGEKQMQFIVADITRHLETVPT